MRLLRTAIWKGTRLPWLPAAPGPASDVSLPSLKNQYGPACVCAAAPAADADHLVERLPVRERVVCSVHGHEAATVGYVLFERRLQRGRPALVGRVVVHTTTWYFAKSGMKLLKSPAAGGVVTTVVANRPVSSSIFFSTGVTRCQS